VRGESSSRMRDMETTGKVSSEVRVGHCQA
jgi:hypothetical protein